MNKTKAIIGQIRHVIGGIGYFLVATGQMTEPGMTEILAAIMIIVGHAGSLISKIREAKTES